MRTDLKSRNWIIVPFLLICFLAGFASTGCVTAKGGDAPPYTEPVKRPEGLPAEAVFNPYTNEYYDSTEVRWDIDLRRYVPLEKTEIEPVEFPGEQMPVYSQADWINDHQGTTDPVELALIDYYQANSAYREAHPETMARSDWGIDYEGEFSIITGLGVQGLPGLLKEVNSPFRVQVVVAVETICKMNIGGIFSFTDNEVTVWKTRFNAKTGDAEEIVTSITDSFRKGEPIDNEAINNRLTEVGIFALPYFYTEVIDNSNDALLKYAVMVLPEKVLNEYNIEDGTPESVLKEALASCVDEIEIIKNLKAE